MNERCRYFNFYMTFVLDNPKSKLTESFKKMAVSLTKSDLYMESAGVEKARQTTGQEESDFSDEQDDREKLEKVTVFLKL